MQNAARVARELEELATLVALAGEPRLRVAANQHAAHVARELERLVRALSLPVFPDLGACTGAHPAPARADRLRSAGRARRARGVARIEINADPHRLDLPPEWLPAARARNIPFVMFAGCPLCRLGKPS